MLKVIVKNIFMATTLALIIVVLSDGLVESNYIEFSCPAPNCNNWSNGYAAFNRAGNHMYHTGIDLAPITPGSYDTPVKAAAYGQVILAESNWSITHGFGKVVILRHTGTLYTLYGHLDSINIIEGAWVSEGQQIGIMGNSTKEHERDPQVGIHLHFEVKSNGILQSPNSDGGNVYYGYTPDLPDPYGYTDPLVYIHPFPAITSRQVALHVVGQEGGSTVPDRGIRLYTGPGIKYGVLGWTGGDQFLVADAEAISNLDGDSISRKWYRVYMPNRLGPSYGWVASKKSDGTALIVEAPAAIIAEVINDDGIGWKMRRDPSIDCNVSPSNCVRVWDNLYGTYRNALAWNGLKFVQASTFQTGGWMWHQIHIPKTYFIDPGTTGEVAPPKTMLWAI